MNSISHEREDGFTITTITVARAALWREARDLCDDALDGGFAFVALLDEAGAFGDERVLVDTERQRARLYRRNTDRDNFVLGRTMIRHLVQPTGAPMPCALSSGPHGKPFLPGCPAFNLSHSAAFVACAVSRYEPIGIDVEAFLRLDDYRALLAATTHLFERRVIDRAEPGERLALFKRCWTRKEAVLKATGIGLSDDLRSIDVCLDVDRPVIEASTRLRLVDLSGDVDPVTIAMALDASVAGVVVVRIEAAT